MENCSRVRTSHELQHRPTAGEKRRPLKTDEGVRVPEGVLSAAGVHGCLSEVWSWLALANAIEKMGRWTFVKR